MICSPEVPARGVANAAPLISDLPAAASSRKKPARGLFSGLLSTARLVHPEPNFRDALARVKYFLRGLSTPRLTAQWLAVLNSPKLQPLVQHPHPLIYCKLQRPYLHRQLDARARLAVLQRHYRFVQEQLSQNLRTKIFQPGGCVLAVLPAPQAGYFTLRLSYARRFGKEGDLNLEIIDEETSGPLFTLSFTVTRFEKHGPSEFFIGGLQGHHGPAQKDLIIGLTRSMHGLRPKALLVFTLQRLAQLWNFSTIRAVSDQEHIYRRAFKRKDLHACYDDFWRECLGELLPDGNFELPAFPVARNVSELPKNKRPLYRRRYEMLELLGEEIHHNLEPAVPVPQPALITG